MVNKIIASVLNHFIIMVLVINNNMKQTMASGESQPKRQLSSTVVNPPTSCRKKKSESATFLEDVKDHIDEFIHASMDEHKTCFKKSIQKMFAMSKVVAERSCEVKEVESSLHLQTTASE